jgi:3-deoxy-D-manno-octulosonic-acid transferase
VQWSINALYASLVAVLPIYGAVRVARDSKARSRWLAYLRDITRRLGSRRPRTSSRPCVWVHGVSVGEVKAAARLVQEIERAVPGVEIVITVTTDTGHRVARTRYPGRRVEFYPPDLSWIVNDALDALRPDLMILVESEFWPNFLFAARERRIPVALVNGKMSERSARRFQRFGAFSRHLLSCLHTLCVQLPLHEERFARLGVDRARIHVTGNMKFDNIPIKQDRPVDDEFRDLLGTGDGLPVVVAGSTHPGEERALARIHRRLADDGTPFRLVVAPRHPARAESVEADMRREGADVVRRSALVPGRPPAPRQIVMLDTVGELERVYAQADVVFVGGSLVPHGGQNMMEPASLGRPVVVGPRVHNFRGEVEMLLDAGGLVLVRDVEGLEVTLRAWLHDLEGAAAMGTRAREAIERSKGATERTLERLRPLLEALGERAAARS